mmetsp:Transcript_23262/g.59421  ORF Transcript_23262/g.59421 Transcript_23262/m.59421 type:complete len:704 (-) Transcript_23262:480-2591(-)
MGPTVLLLCLASVLTSSSAEVFNTVRKVKAAIYEEQKYQGGLYKLLNRTGPIGSSGPEHRVKAPLYLLQDINTRLTADRTVLVPSQLAQPYLALLQADASARAHVRMVLVYPDALPAQESGESTFPMGAEYAPYGDQPGAGAWPWNPAGSGTVHGYLGGIPVFKLSGTLAADVEWRARYNMQNDFKQGLHWAEGWLYMNAEDEPGSANSTACLTSGTCSAIGGFSVWAAVPPLPYNETTKEPMRSGKPVTLVVSNVDANGLFHDDIQAASTLTGVVAMLTALDILRSANASANYTRQLVFAAITGDPWNYMGSRRLSWDIERGTTYTAGLNWTDIDQVVEIGPLGRAYSEATNSTSLFLHTQPSGEKWGDATQLRQAFMDAANSTTEVKISADPASRSNPGLPPSSLYSFLRAKPSLSGLYISEFDSQYINPYYASSYDNASYVAVQPITHTAIVLARMLHKAALGPDGSGIAPPDLQVDMARAAQVVVSLVQCMMLPDPGMSCATARDLLNPDYQVTDSVVSYAVKNYVGVLQLIHPDPQEPFYKKTVSRFLWNLMGRFAAVGEQGDACAFQANQCPAGWECIGWKGSNKKNAALMGRCWRTTVRYAPSLTTALDFIPNANGAARFYFSNASADWDKALGWPQDPMWTESYWPVGVPFIQVMLQEDPRTEKIVLAVGLSITAVTAAVAWWARTSFEKHLKRL